VCIGDVTWPSHIREVTWLPHIRDIKQKLSKDRAIVILHSKLSGKIMFREFFALAVVARRCQTGMHMCDMTYLYQRCDVTSTWLTSETYRSCSDVSVFQYKWVRSLFYKWVKSPFVTHIRDIKYIYIYIYIHIYIYIYIYGQRRDSLIIADIETWPIYIRDI